MRAQDALKSQRRPVDWQSLTFSCPPSANALTFNAPGKGRIPTKAYADWIRSAGYEIAAQRPGCVSGAYFLTMRVRRATLRRDLSNYIKATEDLLVKMGVVDDDRCCTGLDVAWTDEGQGVSVLIASTQSTRETKSERAAA